MSTANPRKRSTPFKVQLTPQLHADLIALSESVGMTPATVASMAIGLYVRQQMATVNAGQTAVTAMVDKLAPDFAKQMSLITGATK